MSITPLPDPPSRSDPTNFPERADAFMAALPGFATEANALAEQVDEAAGAAEQYKDSAGSSAIAAGGSAANALLSETHAQSSAAGAAQARADAEAARDLAEDWASKASGTVGGTPFLSAKQYAELAAQGAGVPIYAANAIPITDMGPIYVVGVGPMEFGEGYGRYISVQPLHGQCRFSWASATSCVLLPFDGEHIVVDGVARKIPGSGIVFSNAGLTPGVTYNAYVHYDGSALVGEWSPFSHMLGHGGVRTKFNDNTRTLVGKARCTGDGSFQDTAAYRGVASWFNRQRTSVTAAVANVGVSSTSDVVIPGILLSIFGWSGTSYTFNAYGYGTSNIATGSAALTLYANGGSSGRYTAYTVPGANYSEPFSAGYDFTMNNEELSYFQVAARVGSGTATLSYLAASVTVEQ